jgi:hypothetical protein|tara:strand:- start:493 stop:645 length:153 start_codon:yes stop_codon:yes gene_type:complete
MFTHLKDVFMDYSEHFTLSIGFSYKFLKGCVEGKVTKTFAKKSNALPGTC